MITDKRVAFKPFEYQWAADYWEAQRMASWIHTEIDMTRDVNDWKSNITPDEKEFIGFILKTFAQTECEVGDYWSAKVPKWFPVPEIKMMAQEFGGMETVHANAYSVLNDTLGFDDFAAFLEDETAMARLGEMISINGKDNPTLEEIAVSLGVFSGLAEGVMLFSSFAAMMSFAKGSGNRMVGINQQMVASVKDESMHSEAGCKLFRTLIEEHPELDKELIQDKLLEAFQLGLKNEMIFIEQLFGGKEITTIGKEELKNFIYDRANRKLAELGIINRAYKVDQDLLKQMDWFYTTVAAPRQNDNFNIRNMEYSKTSVNSETLWND